MAFTAERTSVVQGIQIAKETTLGTAASGGFVTLNSISIKPSPSISTNPFTPNGTMWDTVAPVGKDMTNLKFESTPQYGELDWILGSLLCTGSGTTTKVYNPKAKDVNTPQFYTIQSGASGNCEAVAGVVVTSATFSYTRDKFSISGDMIGQDMDFGATWVAGATNASGTVIEPKYTTVTLGSKLTRCKSAEITISNRWKDVWVLDGSESSYVNVVETKPTGTAKLRVEADAAGKALIASVRAGNPQQNLVITMTNGTKVATMDVYLLITNVSDLSDDEGVYCFSLDCSIAYNATADYAVKATVTP